MCDKEVINIVLDKSGCGFSLTETGYKELISRKALKGLEWTEKYIDENICKKWFRTDKDLISLIKESEDVTASYDVVKYEYEIIKLKGARWDIISIHDEKVKIEECEAKGFEERLIIEMA